MMSIGNVFSSVVLPTYLTTGQLYYLTRTVSADDRVSPSVGSPPSSPVIQASNKSNGASDDSSIPWASIIREMSAKLDSPSTASASDATWPPAAEDTPAVAAEAHDNHSTAAPTTSWFDDISMATCYQNNMYTYMSKSTFRTTAATADTTAAGCGHLSDSYADRERTTSGRIVHAFQQWCRRTASKALLCAFRPVIVAPKRRWPCRAERSFSGIQWDIK